MENAQRKIAMNDAIFTDKGKEPDEKSLKMELGNAFQFYREILTLCSPYRMQWNLQKSSGWILKAYDSKKALFWLVTLSKKVRLSFALREKERESLLKKKMRDDWRKNLEEAKKYPEGYAFRVEIAQRDEAEEIMAIIEEIKKHR